MNSKRVPATHYVYRVFCLALLAAGLMAVFPGHARATLFSPSVEATIGFSTASQASGPVILTASQDGLNAGVRTNYGSNGAATAMWGTRPYGPPTGTSGVIGATSKWTDILTVYTPDVSMGTPIDLVFSVWLHGHLGIDRTAYVSVGSQFDFSMLANEYGSWVTNPHFGFALPGGDGYSSYSYATDVDEIRPGRLTVPNGYSFNLISTLSTVVEGDFWGPWGTSFAVESLFGDTAEYLGGSVQVNGAPVTSFTITSGSGFNYGNRSTTPPPTAVPEPSTILLLGAGLAGLGLWGRKRMERS